MNKKKVRHRQPGDSNPKNRRPKDSKPPKGWIDDVPEHLRDVFDDDLPPGPLASAGPTYARRRARVFPLGVKSKKPAIAKTDGGHGYKDATTNIDQICEWAREYPGANVGIAVGLSGLYVVDADSPEALLWLYDLVAGDEIEVPDDVTPEEWQEVADRISETFGDGLTKRDWNQIFNAELGIHPLDTLTIRTRPGRYQFWFKYPAEGEWKSTIGELHPGVDTRGIDGYVCAPPSIHPETGEPYVVVNNARVRPIPESVLRALEALRDGKSAPAATAPATILRPAAEGERLEMLKRYAGHLRSWGIEDVEPYLRKAYDHYCVDKTPPVTDQEIANLAASAEGWEVNPHRVRLREFNRGNALVLVGASIGIFDVAAYEKKGELIVRSDTATAKWYANQPLPDWTDRDGAVHAGGPFIPWWLRHKRRRQYPELTFDPSAPPGGGDWFEPEHPRGDPDPRRYNLWRGFSVAPDASAGSCARFLAHVRDHVAAGDAALYDKIVAWFAQLVQEPGAKLGTSLVLRGEQGTGKTIVGEVVGHLLGTHYLLVADARYVTGHFNVHLARLLLLQADEAFWAGDKAAEGVLKNLITNPALTIEMKFKDPIRLPNHARLLVTSNADWVVPATLRERRFIVADVTNPDHTNDREYFGAMLAELDAGGYAALLAYLQGFDWRAGRPWELPPTAGLAEQKETSLGSAIAYLLDVAHGALIIGDHDGSGITATDFVHRDYLQFCREHGYRRPEAKHVLFRRMNDFLTEYGAPKIGRVGRYRGRGFPALAEIRAAFERALGPVDWEEDGAESWLKDDGSLSR